MAVWRESRAITRMKAETNTRFPDRSKISDGTVGDLSHQARLSDHNPDINGIVHAWDCTKDDELNVAQHLVNALIRTKDKRLKYMIWEGEIMSGWGGPSPWIWRKYTGANGHYHHAHISVLGDDGSPWLLFVNTPTPTPPEDDMTPAQEAKLDRVLAILERHDDDYLTKGKGVRQVIAEIDTRTEEIVIDTRKLTS
jgi:hypothetical protein